MRNLDRIDLILSQIRDLWVKYPDLRLVQLLVCAIKQSEPCPDIFNIEDDVLSNRLKACNTEAAASAPEERDPGDINDPDRRRGE